MLFTKIVGSFLTATLGSLVLAQSTTNGSFTFYDMPTPVSGPCDSATGPDGALWVQNILVDTIVRIDPLSGEVSGSYICFDVRIAG